MAMYALAATGAAVALKTLIPPSPLFKKSKGKTSVELGNSTFGALENGSSKQLLCKPKGFDNVETLYDLIKECTKRYATRKALGERTLIERSFDDKGFEKLQLGEFSWKTYAQIGEDVDNMGKGLVDVTGLKAGDIVTIYAETRADWLVSFHACGSQSLTVATVYATLGADGAAYAINQTMSTCVVADAKLLKTLLKVVEQCPHLKTVIAAGEVPQDLVAKAAGVGLTVYTVEAIIAKGKSSSTQTRPPKPSDTCMIMYTSGTTGPPKGVVIWHSNFLAGVSGLHSNGISKDVAGFTPDKEMVYAAYLPLAHIMEVTIEMVVLLVGGSLGYGSPGTLTDTSPKIKDCKGDIVLLKPTFFLCAPLIMDKVRSAVSAKLAKASASKQKMFACALSAGKSFRSKNSERGFVGSPKVWNAILFKKLQAMLGGRVSWIASGSAPLSVATQEFMEVCFNCPVVQGFALTETCCGGTTGLSGDRTPSQVGAPMPCCRVKLEDWPEGGYYTKDNKGEVLIGGPSVSQGYFNPPGREVPDLTKKNVEDFEIDSEGVRWFRTGDVGFVGPDGNLRIVDRKKELVKLKQGEYVALSKVEGVLGGATGVDQVLVHGDGEKDFVLACIVPGAVVNPKGLPLEELCKDAAVLEQISKSCAAACKAAGLNKMETPGKYLLCSEPWTVENELLTPTQKKKRPAITKFLAADIKRVYG